MLISTGVYTHALGYCAITTTRRKGWRIVTKCLVTDWIVILLVWDNGKAKQTNFKPYGFRFYEEYKGREQEYRTSSYDIRRALLTRFTKVFLQLDIMQYLYRIGKNYTRWHLSLRP
jgi:hypothetical protein